MLFPDIKPNIEDSSLVLSYDGTIKNNQLIDCSKNARHATINSRIVSEKTKFGNVAKFCRNINSYATTPLINITGNISFRIIYRKNSSDAAYDVLIEDSSYQYVCCSYYAAELKFQLILDGFKSINGIVKNEKRFIFCDCVYDGTYMYIFANGQLIKQSISYAGLVATINHTLNIGRFGDTMFPMDSQLKLFSIYNRAITLSEHVAEFERIKRESIQYISDPLTPIVSGVTSGQLSSTPFSVISGNVDVSTVVVNGENYKVIEGAVSTTSLLTASYNSLGCDYSEELVNGEWEFTCKLGNSSASIYLYLKNNLTASYNGYMFRFLNGQIALASVTAGASSWLMYNNTGYLDITKAWTFRIQRVLTHSNVAWYIWHREAGTKKWILSVMTFGTNPVNEATYVSADYVQFQITNALVKSQLYLGSEYSNQYRITKRAFG
jgi:hypothetical protein